MTTGSGFVSSLRIDAQIIIIINHEAIMAGTATRLMNNVIKQHQHNANKKPTKAYDLVCDLCRPQGHQPPPRLLMLSGTPSERWLHTNHTPKSAPSGPRTDPNAAGTKSGSSAGASSTHAGLMSPELIQFCTEAIGNIFRLYTLPTRN